jgi:hypothetical protein
MTKVIVVFRNLRTRLQQQYALEQIIKQTQTAKELNITPMFTKYRNTKIGFNM